MVIQHLNVHGLHGRNANNEFNTRNIIIYNVENKTSKIKIKSRFIQSAFDHLRAAIPIKFCFTLGGFYRKQLWNIAYDVQLVQIQVNYLYQI